MNIEFESRQLVESADLRPGKIISKGNHHRCLAESRKAGLDNAYRLQLGAHSPAVSRTAMQAQQTPGKPSANINRHMMTAAALPSRKPRQAMSTQPRKS